MKMDEMHAAILAPCSPEAPCGENLSFSPEFDRIQEARREDDPSIDYGEWQAELKQADWQTVVTCCTELLASRSKDMRLSAWLAEGLTKMNGLSGLEQGMRVQGQLLERFGHDIHPQAEDGDQEQRIGSLTWFIVRMSTLARQVPLTEGSNGVYNLNDYEAAKQLHAQVQRNPDAAADLENKTTLDKISNAVRKTAKDRYVLWNKEIDDCLAALGQLAQVADGMFGIDGPSFSPLRTSLEAMQTRLKGIAIEIGITTRSIEPIVSAPTSDARADPGSAVGEATSGRGRGIHTRAQALEMLREVATFFHNTEPHSPVAYLADKAAQWGTMSLHDWLRNVVKDRGTLTNIEELLGVDVGGTEP
jgi:type VI secretion system protein ImpA